MEPATFQDIQTNFLAFSRKSRLMAHKLCPGQFDPQRLVYDLRFATMFARLHYYRRIEPLPLSGDLAGQAAYWKAWYNTPLGAGTTEEYIRNINEEAAGVLSGEYPENHSVDRRGLDAPKKFSCLSVVEQLLPVFGKHF